MNSYQMVLHRPVETTHVLGNFNHSLQPDPLPESRSVVVVAAEFGGGPSHVSEARHGAPGFVVVQPNHDDDAVMNGAPGVALI